MKLAKMHNICAALLSAMILLTAGCSSADKSAKRLTVAVGIPPMASLVSDIVGDSATVVTMLKSQANPEAFEPTVNDMKQVYSADIYLATGYLPFEQTLLERIGDNSNVGIIDTSTGITPLYGTHSGEADHGHDHGSADPHTWTSVKNLRLYAANILSAVSEADPSHAAYYQANFNRLDHRLDSLDQALAQKLEPQRGATFLVWHPSLSYFARDYGLQQVAVGAENKETSALDLKRLLNKAANSDIKAFFIQSNYDSRQADNISRQLGIQAVTLNPLDGDWLGQFTIIANALTL